jgi:creatinine amidohydrolase
MPQTGGGEFFGGNLSVDGSVLGAFAEGVIAQIIRLGFTRVLLLSWHWENMRVLWEAGVRAYETVRNPDVTITVIDNPGQLISATTIARVFGEDFAGWDLEHASIAETSLMEWLYPDLVRAHLIVDDEPQGVVPYEVIPANRGRAPRSGVFGPATRASRDKGDLLARDLTEGIGEIISRELKVVNASPSRTLRGRSAGRAEQGEQRLARSHGTAAPDAGGSSSEPDEAGGF